MLQIWGLVLFYGLVTQSSAQLDAIPVNPVGALSPPLSLTPPDLLSGLLGGLTKGLHTSNVLGILQNLPILDILKIGGGSSGGLIGGLLPKLTSIIPGLHNIISINVTNPVILELGLEQSPDGHRLFVTIPLGMVLELKTFLTGELLKLDVNLNIIVELIAVRDKDGKVHLVIGDCKHDPGSLKITLLEGVVPTLVQELVDTVTKTLIEGLPHLLQKEICPLVNEILSGLDITLVHDVAEILIHGLSLHLKL
ncbi:LOW QUALITY PROTEIN: BPI fold-containing family A member 1-like [Dromiciops gliroides]|uniref:LOW QUALITY PROTEIN: BPI fold-containing family A member 1-like n=1 Tax=Dromiciops gliroides TaxID=33562 RepID=UPI001CC6BD88|nr:LOW QUALITY PROTEIN: BPI fold-containing family A member 1-like [Dromiciops gliroides]